MAFLENTTANAENTICIILYNIIVYRHSPEELKRTLYLYYEPFGSIPNNYSGIKVNDCSSTKQTDYKFSLTACKH